jgi:hypothetical protein
MGPPCIVPIQTYVLVRRDNELFVAQRSE